MKARALVCDCQRNFTLAEVELPEPADNNLVVRTTHTGVSIGTEFMLIRGTLDWGPYPICTGYQGVGVVEHVGADVRGFSVGDKVYFRDNRGIRLADGQPVSGVSGTHCSMAVIDPDNTSGVAILPEGVDEDAASSFVMPACGLFGVDMANPRLGQTLVVHGVGLIGLGVVAAASHRGCVVVAVDLQRRRLDIARQLGADHVINAAESDVREELAGIAPDGADVVFECTGVPACIDPAIALCKPLGKFVFQGNYGAAPITWHFLPPHGKKLTAYFPCDDGRAPCRRAVLKHMAAGALRWEHTITHRVEASDSPDFYARIDAGRADEVVGGVIRWS